MNNKIKMLLVGVSLFLIMAHTYPEDHPTYPDGSIILYNGNANNSKGRDQRFTNFNFEGKYMLVSNCEMGLLMMNTVTAELYEWDEDFQQWMSKGGRK